jgi:hypothetical protein
VWSGCSWDGSSLNCGGVASPPSAPTPTGIGTAIENAVSKVAGAAKAQFCLHPDVYGAAAAVTIGSILDLELAAAELAALGAQAGGVAAQNLCGG